jgi:hypothetical protein
VGGVATMIDMNTLRIANAFSDPDGNRLMNGT